MSGEWEVVAEAEVDSEDIGRRTRNRICKICKFTTSNAKVFLQHQLTAHTESDSLISSGDIGDVPTKLSLNIPKQRKNSFQRSVRSSSVCSGSHPGSPHIMSDPEMIEDVEEELMSGGDVDDREEMVIGKAVLPTRTYTCQDCGMSTTSARNHLYHQLEEHKYDFVIYECDICDYATRYKQKLPRHRKCHFNNLRPGIHRSPHAFSTLLNNNNVVSPKHLEGPVFPDESIAEECDMDESRQVEDNQESPATNSPQLTDENEQEQGHSSDNARMGKLVSAENPNAMETIQLIDEGENSSDGQGVLQIDMSRAEEEQLPPSPVKDKPVTKDPSTASPSILKPKVKRTTPVRQWVDPAKYITLTDEEGIKYSCSKCGNVYKWRKSLSKHWKEKHDNETPPPVQNRSTSYTSLSIPKLSPAVSAEKKSISSLAKYSPSQVHSKYHSSSPARGELSRRSVSPAVFNRSPQSVYKTRKSPHISPSMISPKPAHSSSSTSPHMKCDEDVLDLSVKSQVVNMEKKMEPITSASSNIPDQDQPLDFSSKPGTAHTQLKSNGLHIEYNTQTELSSLMPSENPRSFQCSKCAYIAVSKDDFKRHHDTHVQKKFQRCGQCHAQFANVDDLNRHFVMEHQEQLEDLMEEEESLLKSHLMGPPVTQTMTALSTSCMVCSTSFMSTYELARHFSNTHSTLPNPYLNKNYVNLGISKRGLSEDTEQPESKKRRLMEIKESTDRVHTCNICGYSSSWKNDLTLHMKKYHPLSRPFSREGSPLTNDQGMILPTVLASHNKNNSARSITTSQNSQVSKELSQQATLTSQQQQYLADIPDTVDLSQEGTVLVIPEAPEEKSHKVPIHKNVSPGRGKQPRPSPGSSAEMLLPYKCSVCEYRARWPSEITQHMKNHSDEKPYCCPRCSYRSKWKWDVVKHLKRCGGGTIKDVIDTTKTSRESTENVTKSSINISLVKSTATAVVSSVTSAPPNVTVVPGASLQEAPKPQCNMSDSSGKVVNQKPTIFRSIINQGQYHCLECPFVGSSPAELKRHVILHSDEKPFSCRDCSYSSRWKCDLKKHLRTYNHQPAHKVILASTRGRRSLVDKQSTSPDDSPTTATPTSSGYSVSSANPAIAAAVLNAASPVSTSVPSPSSSDTSNQSTKSALYQCEKCPYATHKKSILESHMKIHSQRNEMGSRLKCKKCDFEAADLPEFLQHKLTHSQMNQDQDTSIPSPENSNSIEDGDTDSQSPKEDPAVHSMRHRRKPIRQFKCSKCPYVCFKKNGLELHEAMHEPRGMDAHKCLYCDYNVYNASLLQQHLRLHPEHHQQEWGEDGEEVQEADSDDPWGMQQQTDVEDNTDIAMEEEGDTFNMDDEEEERLQQQVVTQEMSIMAASAIDTQADRLSESSSGDGAVLDLAKKPVPTSEMVTMFSMSDFEDRLPREVWSASYQCTRCPYLTQHRANYDKHVRMHGTKNKFTCEWCDWSIDRLNLLYRHAKFVHPEELAKQEKNDFFDKVRDKSPLVLEINPKPKKIKAVAPFYVESNKNTVATDLSIPKPSTPNTDQMIPTVVKEELAENLSTKVTLSPTSDFKDIDNSSSLSNPVTTSSSSSAHTVPAGVTVATGIGRKRKKLYTCQKCGYSTDILSNIQRHCEKHGQMARYVCDYCDYALDRQNLLWQHMKLVHKVTVKPEFMSPRQVSQGLSNLLNISDIPTSKNNLDSSINSIDYEVAEESVDDAYLDLQDEQVKEESTDINMGLQQEMLDSSDITWKGEVMQMYEVDGKRIYRCAKCKYTTSNITNCSNHMKQHGANNRYTCDYCDYSLDQVHLLYYHMKTIHADEMKQLEAEMSEEELEPFSVEAYLRSNYHTRANPQAPVSLLSTESKPQPVVNVLDKVGVDAYSQGKRKLLECHTCPYKVKSREALNKHLSMHEQKRKYKCKYCDYSVDRMNLMYQHIRVHNQTESSESLLSISEQNKPEGDVKEEKVPPLKIIRKPKSYVLHSSLGLSKKFTKMKKRVRYGCSKCPYTSFCKNNILKHRKLHIIRSKYKCHHCNYSATKWNLLNQHVKCHEQIQQDEQDKIIYDSPTKSESGSTSSNEQENEDLVTDAHVEESKTDIISEKDTGVKASKCRLYICRKCPFGSNSSFELKKHVQLHDVSLKYKCDYCSYSLDRLNLMYQHRKLHSKSKGFNPNLPPRMLLNKPVWSNMQRQLLKGIRKLKSGKLTRASANVHVNNVEKTEDEADTNQPDAEERKNNPGSTVGPKFECKMCPQRCNALSKLKVHVMLHGVVKKFICDHCDWSCDRLNLVYQHRRVHRFERNFDPDVSKERLVNEACESSSSNRVLSILPKAQTPIHLKATRNAAEDEEKPRKKLYSCDSCPFSCDNKQSLAHHNTLHLNRGQYQCEKCTYSVNRLNLLYQHKRLHDPPSGGFVVKMSTSTKKRLKCPKCPYHSHSRTLLDLHSTMHASGRKYTCQFCDYSIDRFNLLQQHMKVHMETSDDDSAMEISCKQTPNRFPDKTTMSAEKGKRFVCDRCPYTTTSRPNFETHKAQHASRNKLQCSFCDYSIGRIDHMMNHIRLHLSDKNTPAEKLNAMIVRSSEGQNLEPKVSRHTIPGNLPNNDDDGDNKIKDITLESTNQPKDGVYTCQYCDREFDNEETMQRHEAQHLIGY